MEEQLPALNGRIKAVVDYFDKGNVLAFSKRLENISQQRLNRIFNIDTRTKKYPSVPDDLLTEIAAYLPSVNLDWLLTGKGEMLREGYKNDVHQHNCGIASSNFGSGNVTNNDIQSFLKMQLQMQEAMAEKEQHMGRMFDALEKQLNTKDVQIASQNETIKKLLELLPAGNK